jgi:5-hydroxyisourate hydrolase-like protein (transthyretin family)
MSRRSYSVGIIAVFVLCALILTGLSGMFAPVPNKTRTASNDGWIEGYVSNGTGPIDHAYMLYFMSSGSGGGPIASTWTDVTGHYNLTVLGGIAYTVIAFNGSYYTAGGGAAPAAGQSVWLNLTMSPIAPLVADVVLTGFVLDGTGNPVPGGNVAGYTNDPITMGQGAPMYGNMTTADPVTGRYTVNVIPGTIGGGVAALDFPGYPFIDNTTQNPFVSGQTYWINITLSIPPSTDDAVVSGHVWDNTTSAPLADVVVTIESYNSWNGNRGYSNLTLTNASGYYEMNVTNGSARMSFSKLHYNMYQVEGLPISPGNHLTINATLTATDATVRGNVTDHMTGLPLANVTVYTHDSTNHFTVATTNSLGEYTLEVVAGPSQTIGAQRNGYGNNNSIISILPGQLLWKDIGLWPLNAWTTGAVTDLVSGAPVANTSVQFHSTSFDRSAQTNASGEYNITLMSGDYSVQVYAYNYSSYSATAHMAPGGNVYDIELMPQNPPLTTRLYGWVNDSGSGLGIFHADVQAGLAAPYQGQRMSNSTNSTGYYEMWIPPVMMQYTVTAQNHVHAEGFVDATGLTVVRLDVVLGPDLWGPNVTYSQSPRENVSWTNPSWINVTVQEKDPQQLVLAQFMFVNASSGTSDYALVQMLYDTFDPLNMATNNLPFTKIGDTYTISYPWTALANGGWLRNGSAQQHFGSFEMKMGPNSYQGLRGLYHNSTLGSSYSATAWFDNITGNIVFFSFDNGSMQQAFPSDTTGTFAPQVSVVRVNDATNSTNWINTLTQGNWSVVGLQFTYDSTLPSGKYVTEFSVQDFGNRGAGNVTFLTVDNDPPVANAGSDQTAPAGQLVLFDGTSSTDNVGIVNYTWTVETGGTPVTLWGPSQSFSFPTVGVYNVTLVVRDGAGHTSTDVMRVTVSAAIPEFPTVIIPISGMILIIALVRSRRSRLGE